MLKKDLQLLRRQDKHNSDAPHIICEVKEWQIQEKTAGAMCCEPARVKERMAVIPILIQIWKETDGPSKQKH